MHNRGASVKVFGVTIRIDFHHVGSLEHFVKFVIIHQHLLLGMLIAPNLGRLDTSMASRCSEQWGSDLVKARAEDQSTMTITVRCQRPEVLWADGRWLDWRRLQS